MNKYDKEIIQDFLDELMSQKKEDNQKYIREAVRIIESELVDFPLDTGQDKGKTD